jgi:hypothetical protein
MLQNIQFRKHLPGMNNQNYLGRWKLRCSSSRFSRHRFVDSINCWHPRSTQPHLPRNSSVASQFIGSQGCPHTNNMAPVLRVSQQAMRSRQSSRSSKEPLAIIRLSLSLGNGRTSNQGWCFVVHWMNVGRRLEGRASLASNEREGPLELNIESVLLSLTHSIVMAIAAMLSLTARWILSLLRVIRWSTLGRP